LENQQRLVIPDANITELLLRTAIIESPAFIGSDVDNPIFLLGNAGAGIACVDVAEDAPTAPRVQVDNTGILCSTNTTIGGTLTVNGSVTILGGGSVRLGDNDDSSFDSVQCEYNGGLNGNYTVPSCQAVNDAIAAGSHTITHRTNIIDFNVSQIGCFAETTGELATVYGSDYTPTLTRATDAIVKVTASNTLNNKILGIITDEHTFANLGDVLCVVVQGPTYRIGDILAPDESGLCRVATDDERRFIKNNGLPRVRITGLIPGKEFVLAFIQ
jgi:hypothetical protein